MFERIRQMVRKEFIQVFRDARTRGVVFLAPLIQVLVFGYAVSTDVRHVATAVYDLDQSAASRELITRFIKSGYFDASEFVRDDAHARNLMDHGTVRLILRINRGFENSLSGPDAGQVQIIA